MTADTPRPTRRPDRNGGRWSDIAKTLHRIDGLVDEPDGPPTPAELAELTAQLAAAATPAERFVAAEIRAAVLEETGIDLTPAEPFRGYFTPPGADDHAETPIPGAERHAPGLTEPTEGEGTGWLTRALRRIFR